VPYEIFCDNEIEARWFKNLNKELQGAETVTIGKRDSNIPIVESLIEYDRPDIILLKEKEPVLVVEKTREVPTGHNVGQRVARLVRAVEMKIPTIKFFPFDARKHGEYSGICNLNIRILSAFENMWKIHATPMLAVNWKCDKNGELIDDGSEDDELKEIIEGYILSGCSKKCKEFEKQRIKNIKEYETRVAKRKNYAAPPPSVVFKKTKTLIKSKKHLLKKDQINHLQKNDESLIYLIGMTEKNCRREDPYTGTQFIYDYAYCRNGREPDDKNKNLILEFPKIKMKVWNSKNPNDKKRKSCNWYLVANALCFKDGVLILR
jgi:hypothetical protein